MLLFVLCLVTLRRSLEQLKSINLKLVNLTHTSVPRVLVGSKKDLGHSRQVSTEEGMHTDGAATGGDYVNRYI